MDIEAFVRHLPMAELHLHLEGTLDPLLMLAPAERKAALLARLDRFARDSAEAPPG